MVSYREGYNRPMSSYKKAYKWRRMSVLDGVDLKERWGAKIRDMVDEPLLKREPCVECTNSNDDACRSNSWAVENLLELTRLVGALQHQNPQCLLWFRGEHNRHSSATPKACRDKNQWDTFLATSSWFDCVSGQGRLFSNRSELARWAILQHYGVPTPLLDVTTSYRIATAFAFRKPEINNDTGKLKWSENVGDSPHISVFATPRPLDGINIFPEASLCLVDLVAELPSHCLRPHVQRAGFLGLTDIVMAGLDHYEKPSKEEAKLDCVRIARICFRQPDKFEALNIEHFFPPASRETTVGGKRDDMSGDYLLRALYELRPPKDGFPKYYWEDS